MTGQRKVVVFVQKLQGWYIVYKTMLIFVTTKRSLAATGDLYYFNTNLVCQFSNLFDEFFNVRSIPLRTCRNCTI